MPGNPPLIDFIRARIESAGPVTFRWFMEQALYHPEHGYYSSGKGATGRGGDYFTNVSVGPLFGKMIAIQFREMWERMGAPAQFAIVEQGANDGVFARDVLESLQTDAPDFARAARYVIVEPFPILEKRQRETLAAFPGVQWRGGVDALDPFRGVHFSNELIDAMPLHVVKLAGGEWRERLVDWLDGAFAWADAPLSSEKLRAHLEKLPLQPGADCIAEVNLDAPDWLDALTPRIEAGWILIADYGHTRAAHFAPGRTGTLACYSRHRRGDDPFQDAGLADITAHVDFTSIAEHAAALGMGVAGYADQHHFMAGLAQQAFPDTNEPPDPAKQKMLRAFTTLMHPNFMGMQFKFLALGKNLPDAADAPLSGFQFSPDASAAL